jgi:biopolymer transport protein ExbB/TolQ
MLTQTIKDLATLNNLMYLPLLILSVGCWAAILDRTLFWIGSGLRRRPIPPEAFDSCKSRRDLAIAGLRHARNRHYTREILLACLESGGNREKIGQAASELVDRMSSRLDTLDMIAKLAPLVGILGTVVGMIMSFAGVNALATTSPVALSNGISVALKTTAYGLVISISASIACAVFRWCIRRCMLRMGRIICETQCVANADSL